MAASQALQWLDTLEKQFDKTFVDLDLILNEIDPDQVDLVYDARRKLTSISAAFAQISQKAQTIFENNARLEAQLLAQRGDHEEVLTEKNLQEKEIQNLILQLHSAQVQLSEQMGNQNSQSIRKKLDEEILRRKDECRNQEHLEISLKLIEKENRELKRYMLVLQTEVYGARLTSKYLDKELAGRIQQIQLLGRKLPTMEHDRLWNQLECEIHLHRNKTVIRACKGRKGMKMPRPPGHTASHSDGIGELRIVEVTKARTEGLGMAITGGREHGVPIMISEIYPDQPVARCGQLYVGDAIIAANGVDLREKTHREAVKHLCSIKETARFEVVYISVDDDSEEEDTEYQDASGYRYRLYDATKTLPVNGEQRSHAPQSSEDRTKCDQSKQRRPESLEDPKTTSAANIKEGTPQEKPSSHTAEEQDSANLWPKVLLQNSPSQSTSTEKVD